LRAQGRTKLNHIMKSQLALSRHYQAALQRHLQKGTKSSTSSAHRLGERALALRMETLDLARIHERAFAALNLPANKDATLKCAEFFNEAILPIVETLRETRRNKAHLNQLNEALDRRTSELATANHQLRQGIIKRESVEAALKKSGKNYTRLLNESLHIQQGLRKLTHKLLAAQEDERKSMSRELRDEIAQTLLGINVRLVSLKKDAKVSSKDLKSRISGTQQLVRQSVTSVRRAARQFRNT